MGLLDRLTSATTLRRFPSEVQQVHLHSDERAQEELNYLRLHKDCRWAILWSDGEVQRFERDSKKIENAFSRSHQHLSSLLEQARLDVKDEHEQALAAK